MRKLHAIGDPGGEEIASEFVMLGRDGAIEEELVFPSGFAYAQRVYQCFSTCNN
jgi:hypothetical protein